MAAQSENESEQLIRMIGEEYQREHLAKWDKYGGLNALCHATCNLPIYPTLSKKEEANLNNWKKEIFNALTKKKSPGAMKLAELKQNIRLNRGPGEQQNKPITVVELMSHVPDLVAILKIYLDTFLGKKSNLFWICVKIFVLVVQTVAIIPIGFL